jgi:hypothetical protein
MLHVISLVANLVHFMVSNSWIVCVTLLCLMWYIMFYACCKALRVTFAMLDNALYKYLVKIIMLPVLNDSMNCVYIAGVSFHHITASQADHFYPHFLPQRSESTVFQYTGIHWWVMNNSPRTFSGVRADNKNNKYTVLLYFYLLGILTYLM